MYTITAIDYLSSYETISFTITKLDWQPETVKALFSSLIAQQGFQLIEVIEGADKMMARFHAKHHEFCLNAEFYSEAIWIEAADEIGAKELPALTQKLKAKLLRGNIHG